MSFIHYAIANFYGDLKLGYIKSDQNWVVYGAKISSGLLSESRYIFAVVDGGDMDFSKYVQLGSIKWSSFQARTTDENHDVPIHSILMTGDRKQLLPEMLSVVERTKEETRYVSSELPISVRLLHNKKKNNTLQWPDKLRLSQALNTFQCVIDLF